MSENLKPEVPEPEVPELKEGRGASKNLLDDNTSVVITLGDAGFISDMLSGAKTPGTLSNLAEFISFFLTHIADYEKGLAEIDKVSEGEYIALAKEFFILDEKLNPTIDEETQKWKLLEGKTEADMDDYSTRNRNIGQVALEKKNLLANKEITVSVPFSVFFEFRHAFLTEIDVEQAVRKIVHSRINPQDHNALERETANFIATLYSVTKKIRSF